MVSTHPTHPRPQKEADSLCYSFAQRCSSDNLPERTYNILTNNGTRACSHHYTAMDTDQDFTISELEGVLHRLKDTAP